MTLENWQAEPRGISQVIKKNTAEIKQFKNNKKKKLDSLGIEEKTWTYLTRAGRKSPFMTRPQ